ncbi:MAG: hypothetical protein MJ252_21870 [archaeon]|nr:hypothetical protein [archaeon]
MSNNPMNSYFSYRNNMDSPLNEEEISTGMGNTQSNRMMTQGIEAYKIKLMDKDSEIFELNKTNKENEKNIENLKRIIDEKEEENQNLKLELQSLQIKFQQSQRLLQNNSQDLENIYHNSENKIKDLSKVNQELLLKKAELEKQLETQGKSLNTFAQKFQQFEKEKEELKEAITDKCEIILKYEKIFQQLRDENQVIPFLKQKINDLETENTEALTQLRQINETKEKIEFEKTEKENELRKVIMDQSKDKVQSQKLFRINYELENLKKNYEQKDRENLNMTEKYKSSLKDSENFVHLVTSEIGLFTNFLENLNTSTKAVMQIPLTLPQNFEGESSFNKSYSLKFEVVIKSLNLLKKKVQEIITSNTETIQKFQRTMAENSEELKNLKAEKDEQNKTNLILKQNLEDLKGSNKDYKNSLEALNQSYINLKDNFIKLKNSYTGITNKTDQLTRETEQFLNNLSTKMSYDANESTNYIPEHDGNISSQKLLEQLDLLIQQKKDLEEETKKLKEKNDKYQRDNQKLFEDNAKLKFEYEELDKSSKEAIKSTKDEKQNEINQQKAVLYEKIKSLSKILEQSNQLIMSYENDVKELKERNLNLEKNLQLLTNSHIELENSINNNHQSLQSEIELKENKNNSLLRELELKDMRIQSLEKMLEQGGGEEMNSGTNFYNSNESNIKMGNSEENKSNVGKLVIRSNGFRQIPNAFSQEISPGMSCSMNFNTLNCGRDLCNLSNNNISNSSFVKNEEHEQELKKLMNCFPTDDTNKGYIIDTTQSNEGNFPEKQIGNNLNIIVENENSGNISKEENAKIPGTLYCIKK